MEIKGIKSIKGAKVHSRHDHRIAMACAVAGLRAEGTTVIEIRNVFERAQAIDDFKSVNAKDLEITKEGDKVVVSFSYEREIHLAGPAWLTLKYTGRTK